jgi:hypothetical protein
LQNRHVDLNNREIAVLVWLGAGFAWAMSTPDVRGSLWQLVKVVFSSGVLLATILAYAAWTVGLVHLAARAGLWESELTSDTVVWALASFALLFNSERILEDKNFLRQKVALALRATILIEVFVNLVVFPLPVELVLVPFVTLLAMLSAFSGTKPEYAQVGKLVDSLLGWIGIALLAFVAISLVVDPSRLDGTTGLRFLLPVWLSLGLLPYSYLVALYAGYERAFKWINFNSVERTTRRAAKWALVRQCRLSARRLGEFRGSWVPSIVSNEAEGAELLRRDSHDDEAEAA